MTFERLIRADVVAWIAALALLFVTAADWYSTKQGDEARRIEETAEPQGGQAGEAEREVQDDARLAAEEAERNAWQADAAIDLVILSVLLAAAALAVTSGVLRAMGRRYDPPLTPSMLAAATAASGALLVIYRIFQPPGLNDAATIKFGAPLALVVLGVLALASVAALRAEESGRAWKEIPAPGSRAGPEGDEAGADRDPASARDEAGSETSRAEETPPPGSSRPWA
jgi:drug/metabolite transporter (DMT)-like permease